MKKDYNTMPEITIKYKKSRAISVQIKGSSDTAEVLRKMYDADTIEYCETAIVIYLDNANQTLAWQKIGIGGMTGVVMDPRTIFSTALKIGACALILSHNHPSGNKKPSHADAEMTRTAVQAGKFLLIKVLDHIIITANDYYSFADNGDI